MALKTRPVEWLLASYAAVVVVVAMARWPGTPQVRSVALGHLLVIALVALFRHPGLGRVGRAAREIAPLILLLSLYGALDVLNGFGSRPTFDGVIQRWEAALFGGQPSRDWWQASPSALWSTVFHAAYFAYYLVVPFPFALFLLRGEPDRARGAVLMVLCAFLPCYLSFLLLPVAGPYYEFARPEGIMVDNSPARLVYGILSGGSSYGAAFPSSHVAGTWAAVAATAAGAPGWAAILLVPAGLLTVGVVYTQMHYAIDVVAGLVVAGVAVIAARRMEARQ